MLTNDLKKGALVKLRNGWTATVMDNGRGNTRVCEVEGLYTEIGSVYSWDIVQAKVDKEWLPVDLTESQTKAMLRVQSLGF